MTEPMSTFNLQEAEELAREGLGMQIGAPGVPNLCPDFLALAALYREAVEALKQIAKPEGRYSRFPLEHASNTIEDMQAVARAVLAKVREAGEKPQNP